MSARRYLGRLNRFVVKAACALTQLPLFTCIGWTVRLHDMDHRWADLARALADLGVWDDVSPQAAAEQPRAVANGQYPLNVGVFDEVQFFADGEELAEGDVEKLLLTMAPALRRYGVALTVQTLDPLDPSEDYVVGINDRRCLVCEADDWEDYRAWYHATVRPLAVVNDLLGQAGATVRVFTLYAGGNDGLAVLLDPRVPDAMRLSNLFDERDVPALASHNSHPDSRDQR